MAAACECWPAFPRTADVELVTCRMKAQYRTLWTRDLRYADSVLRTLRRSGGGRCTSNVPDPRSAMRGRSDLESWEGAAHVISVPDIAYQARREKYKQDLGLRV